MERKLVKLTACIITFALFIGLNIIMNAIGLEDGAEGNPWALVALLVIIALFVVLGLYMNSQMKEKRPVF